jgi:hypothetical protein
MRATTWQKARTMSRMRRVAVLFAAAMMLAACSSVPAADPAQPAPPANYGELIANALKKFKTFSSYTDFQISPLRWVHAETGWNWLTCLRYEDHGATRFYAFFLDRDSIANARYDVRTDRCAAQQYVPFDITTGTVGRSTPFSQQPIY